MPEGTVKFFNRAKGFGFIVPDDGDKEVFLPPAALGGLGGIKLSPGQRVAFDLVEDPKGPKAASLKVLGEAPVPAPMPAKPQAAPQAAPHAPRAHNAVILYCDPATEKAQDIIAALEDIGQPVQVIDITTTPLTVPQLRKWSLAGLGQGLVRRSSSLFYDLQLDDRFIHEDEFWTAVVQHPALISGPILSSRDRVRICRTPADVKAFFALADSDAAAPPKEISSRLMAMMRGEAVPPRPVPEASLPEDDDPEDDDEDESEEDESEEDALEEAEAEPVKKAAAKAARPAAKAKAAPAKKPVAKKAVAAKPVKKKK